MRGETIEEEKALVRRMLAGDERAMEEFADGYFPGLYRFAIRRLGGDAELTRDLVQTTVVKALSKLGSYRGEAPLFTWLCACCRNEMAMYFRKKQQFPHLVELDDQDGEEPAHAGAGEWGSPEEIFVRKEVADNVHAALDRMPPRYARALEWKYLEHLPVTEIAARLKLSLKAAESLLTRARQAFRQGYESLAATRGAEVVAIGARRGG